MRDELMNGITCLLTHIINSMFPKGQAGWGWIFWLNPEFPLVLEYLWFLWWNFDGPFQLWSVRGATMGLEKDTAERFRRQGRYFLEDEDEGGTVALNDSRTHFRSPNLE